MRWSRAVLPLAFAGALACTAWRGQDRSASGDTAIARTPAREPDVIYVPTPERVVDGMLRLAKVGASDVVYDLGCGDGRIVIRAAQQFGARGVGIDIDPERIEEARRNAAKSGVDGRVEFREQDLFEADFREATVVTLYLLQGLNERLRPKLLKELKPGSRIVSHAFDMGDWKPEQTEEIDGKTVYLWTVPAGGQVAGAAR